MARALLPLFLAASLFLACNGHDDSAPPSATPEVPSTSEPTATATPSPGSVTTLHLGDDIEVPHNMALIVETGCWQCDGPTEGFIRVYRDPAGEIRVERLYSPPATSDGAFITGYAAVPDGSELAVSLCARGTCAHLGPPSADARTQILRSTDGGVSWDDIATLEGSYSLVGLAPDGESLLAGPFDPEGQELTPYLLHPSGVVPEPPAGADAQQLFAIARKALVWWGGEAHRLLLADGTPVLDIGPDRMLAYGNPIALDGSAEFIATTYDAREGGSAWTFVASGATGSLRTYQLDRFARVGAWPEPQLLVGNVDVPVDRLPQPFVGYLPAVFDLGAGLIHPIAGPFLSGNLLNGRNHIAGVMRGPFARVVAPGDCLRVRAQPGSVNIVACAADGVLLRDLGETNAFEGETWLRVVTPAGAEGWVSGTFVER